MSTFSPTRERVSVKAVDPEIVALLEAELKVSNAIATILAGRNLSTFQECKEFFVLTSLSS